MVTEPALVVDEACVVGEGPLWHEAEQRLYWVDIPTGRLFRYDPQTGRHEQVYHGMPIGGFTVQVDGALVLFMERGAVKIWRDGALETVIESLPEERETRFNDVIADPMGRVFCGTMPTHDRLGRLYRLDPDGKLTKLLDGVGVSNGMGFSPDRKTMYFTDSAIRTISAFDYDEASGEISNRRPFVETQEGEGIPDGMAVDAEGHIWSARWDGASVYRYGPDGVEEQRITFPAKKVSSITFGGTDYRDAFVTTAGGDDKALEGDGAGALFRLRLGVQGKPTFLSRIGHRDL